MRLESYRESETDLVSAYSLDCRFVLGLKGMVLSAIIPLGKFERVALKDAWPTEDGNFTPWLAHEENFDLLGEALNMELEVEGTEQKVGSFRADILARAIDEAEHRVIIENQFGRTDHGHLGQILTYLAGVEDTKTTVWIGYSTTRLE